MLKINLAIQPYLKQLNDCIKKYNKLPYEQRTPWPRMPLPENKVGNIWIARLDEETVGQYTVGCYEYFFDILPEFATKESDLLSRNIDSKFESYCDSYSNEHEYPVPSHDDMLRSDLAIRIIKSYNPNDGVVYAVDDTIIESYSLEKGLKTINQLSQLPILR